MKTKIIHLLMSVMLLFTVLITQALPKNADEKLNRSPMLLNGKSVSPGTFSAVRYGKISIVNPEYSLKDKIPFYIYLKRDGKIINASSKAHNASVFEYEIAEILKSAKVGDLIVIDPANKTEQLGRRIITVSPQQVGPQFQWFYGLAKKQDGC